MKREGTLDDKLNYYDQQHQRASVNPMGFINREGHYCVKDEETQAEVMKQYLFMHDTKKEWINY